MQVTVKQGFFDKKENVPRLVGQVVDLPEARAKELKEKNLVDYPEAPQKEETPKASKPTKK